MYAHYNKFSAHLPNCEYILIGLALRDSSNFSVTAWIAPSAEQFTLLHIPAQDLFACSDYCPSCACWPRRPKDIFVSGPDRIGRGGRDETKGVGMLEFPVIVSFPEP